MPLPKDVHKQMTTFVRIHENIQIMMQHQNRKQTVSLCYYMILFVILQKGFSRHKPFTCNKAHHSLSHTFLVFNLFFFCSMYVPDLARVEAMPPFSQCSLAEPKDGQQVCRTLPSLKPRDEKFLSLIRLRSPTPKWRVIFINVS